MVVDILVSEVRHQDGADAGRTIRLSAESRLLAMIAHKAPKGQAMLPRNSQAQYVVPTGATANSQHAALHHEHVPQHPESAYAEVKPPKSSSTGARTRGATNGTIAKTPSPTMGAALTWRTF